MNCKNFEVIISDLAREGMLEAALREEALLHTKECKACAAVLEDERALSRGLRAVATSMELREAPARVEADLRAIFRERIERAQSSPVVVQMPQRVSSWQRWYPQAVAAAVLLMFAIGGAAALRMRQEQTPASQPNAEVATTDKGNKAARQAMPVSTGALEPPAEEVVETIASAAEDNKIAGRGQKLSNSEVAAIMGTGAQRRNSYQNVPKSGINARSMTSTSQEIATDFMPVSYGDNLNEIDNGRIVRVEMPRSALAQFGLPVNMDRANERIKADVLIGDDGMARAIRFVR